MINSNLKLQDASLFTTAAVTWSLVEQAGGISTANISSDSESSETGWVSHRVSRKPVTSTRSRIIWQIMQR